MKLFTGLLVVIFTVSAHAAQVKLTWTHDEKGIDGSAVVLTGFKVYWNIQGTQTQGVTPLGPPLAQPWKNINGVFTWSALVNNDLWEPGTTVCFAMTAVAGAQESQPSATVCNLMSAVPDQPNIVMIGTP